MSRLTRFIVLVTGLLGPVVVFEAMRAAFVERLPFGHPENLVLIKGAAQPGKLEFADWFGATPTVSGLTILSYGRATLAGEGVGRRVEVLTADHMTLHVLGLSPLAGRPFSREDLTSVNTALVSPAFWRRELGGTSLARQLRLNGRSYDVIGVAPEALSRLGRFDIVLPRNEGRFWGSPMGQGETPWDQMILGRRTAGASVADVQREIERLQRLRERSTQHSTVTVTSLRDALTSPALPTLRALSLAAAVLFLLAAVTVGMLAAMQSAERLHEFNIRAALGATGGRLHVEGMRPWLAAMAPAAVFAICLAVPLSSASRKALPSLGEPAMASGAVILATSALVILLLLSAFVGTHIPMRLSGIGLFGGAPLTPRQTRGPMGAWVVGAQLSLSLGLICAATVAGLGLHDQFSRDLGLSTEDIQAFQIDLGEGQPLPDLSRAWRRLRVEALGHEGSFGEAMPWMSPRSLWVTNPSSHEGGLVGITQVSSGFFSLLGIRFRAGSDPFLGGPSTSEVVVSDVLAKRLAIEVGSVVEIDDEPRRVAGVVNAVNDITKGVDGATMQAYIGIDSATPPASATVLLRGSAREALRAKARVEAALPDAAVSDPSSLTTAFGKRLERQRLGTALLCVYASLACVLAGLGLHGLMCRRVSQVRREIGVRLALGADQRTIHRELLRPLMLPVVVSAIVGVFVGLQLSSAVAALILWARPLEPGNYAISVLGALLVAVVAAWPALRAASRVQPADLLREP